MRSETVNMLNPGPGQSYSSNPDTMKFSRALIPDTGLTMSNDQKV